MNWIWKSRKPVPPIVEPDWQERYVELARTYAALQVARDILKQELQDAHREIVDLHSAEAGFILWIVNVCVDLPLLKVRIDRCEAAYARLNKLMEEAREKGWIGKL